jgi:neutral ceramidase
LNKKGIRNFMSELQVGIARSIVTPPPGTLLFGYPVERKGYDVDDDLNATALVLKQANLVTAVISIDWCVIDEDEIALIREAIHKATGITPHNITICATHTHSAPMTASLWGWGDANREYLAESRPKIVEAVVNAQAALQTVRVGIGVESTDVSINRREVEPNGGVILGFNEWGPRDRDLTVVRFEGESGPVAQIVHLGAHPTSRGSDPAVSRDWPGFMIDRLETITKAPVLFINGAFGDVAPRTTIGGATGDGANAAREVGLRAAGDAIRAWRDIKEFRQVDLQLLTTDLELPLASLPPLDEVNEQVERYKGKENAPAAEGCECNYWNAVRREHEGTPRTVRIFTQTVTSIGPLVIVPFAGEIFAEIALRLKKASPYPFTLCAGTTNGSHGYYVTRESRGRGGYEVWVARGFGAYLLADNIDDELVQKNLELITQLEAQTKSSSS